ncbi:MAG: hypothetical protein WDZ93_00690 [Candidatus Paceibacterota bacterium]
MRHTLEQQKSFPIFAWICIILFAIAVIFFISKLQSDAGHIGDDRSKTEKALEIDLRTEPFEY